MFYSKSDIYAQDWLDTIFANRNKAYGAYELRQLAPRATNLALLIVVAAVLVLCGAAYARSLSSVLPPVPSEASIVEVEMDDSVPVVLETPAVALEAPKNEQPQQVAQDVSAQDLIKYTEINVTDNAAVTEDIEVTNVVLDKKKLPANISMEGVKGGEFVPKGTFGKTKRDGGDRGLAVGSPTGDPDATNVPLVMVEVMPEPIGGMSAFMQWVADNYEFPQGVLESGAKGLIQVSFVVEPDGSLSSFDVVRDMGYGSGDAAIRLLKKAKKWNPGVQNGRPVRVSFNLPIRLQVTP